MPKLLGYCTNVHAGAGIAETRANLQRFSVTVKSRFSPECPMGLGLWLSAKAARELIESEGVLTFRDWLDEQGLVPMTMNGFPYGDFHQEVVKHDVYLPVWGDPQRTAYTLDLIDILHQLLPTGLTGTISTLPVAWDQSLTSFAQAAEQLLTVARRLAQLKAESSREIVICIEPEPGCLFERSSDAVAFFTDYLFDPSKNTPDDISAARTHLQICHDVCHAAVMFESQAEVLRAYRDAGIGIGKVQISSAISVPFFKTDTKSHSAALARLADFAEDRYLHQTVCYNHTTGASTFFEDLPPALASASERDLSQEEWRIHFHVPLFADALSELATTQDVAQRCLEMFAEQFRSQSQLPHFEVETYAWDVLPPDLVAADLAESISRELEWAANQLMG